MTLAVRNLSAGYRDKIVISDVSFELAPGSIMAFFGHNGAGKSTTLKTILGALAPVQGEVWLDGERIDALAIPDRVARGIRYLPDSRGVFPDLTVDENLDVVARMNPFGSGARIAVPDVLAMLPALEAKRRSYAGTMSGGQQQMLAFGLALLGSPRCILLEEPSVGLQPDLVEALFGEIRRICAQYGISAILVEHKIGSAMNIADHVLIMNNGAVVFDGPPAKARESNFWEYF
ncbi:MAG: ATP-binding cassette domain-containing protein [Burkholderiales bacterium]|nr:ATP-binding cassette domain-containing protein [Burkholderiales bacterium]